MNGVVLCLYSACQFDIIKDFNPPSFELFLRKIALNIQHALVEPGTTIGVTSA
jgi:hypothetical protein